jgi:hypothetical protein
LKKLSKVRYSFVYFYTKLLHFNKVFLKSKNHVLKGRVRITDALLLPIMPRQSERRVGLRLENAAPAIFDEKSRDRAGGLVIGRPHTGDSAVAITSRCDRWLSSYVLICIKIVDVRGRSLQWVASACSSALPN